MSHIKKLRRKAWLLRIVIGISICGFFATMMTAVTPVTIVCALLSIVSGMYLYHLLSECKLRMKRIRRRMTCLEELSSQDVSAN